MKRTMKGDNIRVAESGATIEGYLVKFTSSDDTDLHGEYFSKNTDFWMERGYPVKGQPVLLEHGLDSAFKWIPVGIIENCTEDEIGLWIEARLHDRAYYENMLKELQIKGRIPDKGQADLIAKSDLMTRAVKNYVATGKVGWSSGALPQSVQADGTGHIDSWAIIEGSITMTPAEPNGTEIGIATKSALQELETVLSSLGKVVNGNNQNSALTEAHETPAPIEVDTVDTLQPKTVSYSHKSQGMKIIMDKEQILSVIQEIFGQLFSQLADQLGQPELEAGEAEAEAVMAMVEDEVKAMPEDEIDAEKVADLTAKSIAKLIVGKQSNSNLVKSAVAKALKSLPETRSESAPSKAQGAFKGQNPVSNPVSHIEVRSPYAHWTSEDFSFAASVAQTAGGRFPAVKRAIESEGLAREFIDRVGKEYSAGKIKLDSRAVKSLNAMKANEVMQSVLASYGDEWVPTLWNDTVWDKPRTDVIAPNIFNMIDMPSNPFELPIVGADPTISYVPETTATAQLSLDSTTAPIPSSRVGTGKVTLTAAKLATNVLLSAELDEDSLAFAIPQLRQSAQDALLHAIDSVILNGDTATTGNVNSDGETITATQRSYQAMNGLIKQALVTATGNSLDVSAAAPSLAHIRSLRAKLAPAAAARASNLALVMDVQTYIKLLNDGAILTMDKYGDQATVLTGELGRIDNIPVFATEDLALADTDGKVTQTSNSVDRGRMLLIHRPSWMVGYRRRPTQSMTFIPYFDTWSMVVSVRFDLAGRTEGASDDTVAIAYNIGI